MARLVYSSPYKNRVPLGSKGSCWSGGPAMSIRVQSIRLRKRWLGIGVLALLVLGGSAIYGRLSAERPDAAATFIAGPLAPDISGTVSFRNVPDGTVVSVEVEGLPPYQPGDPPIGPFGFHIHEYASCELGDPANPFTAAGGHWNPDNQPHGNHAGDLPGLFSNDGVARMAFFTDRFTADEVVGHTVILHMHPDDHRTQPAGDSGPRLACGVIVRYAK